MKAYPLESISLERAMQFQFKMIDCITNEFTGSEFLTRGDLGVVAGLNKPKTTLKAEKVVAKFFDSEKAIFVRGTGTSAIRYALYAVCKSNETLLVHSSPIYSTTKTTIDMLGIKTVSADFNDLTDIERVMKQHPEIKAALVQVTRQSISDRYDLKQVIEKIGCQCGADLSCFSCFKLQGPEGIGCVVGKSEYIDFLIKEHYSGGSQTQGWEAMEVLRGLVYSPVMLAIQAKTNDECVERLNQGEIAEVKEAFLANAQSKVLLVEFKEPIAKKVIIEAEKLGGLPNPVGAESKYELPPMFYRVSGTFRASDPTIDDRMIRINPNRSGADTIIRILKESIKRAKQCF